VAIGSLLPDLDGISVFFAHNVYYGSKWFSHRGALHTPLGILPLLILIVYGTPTETGGQDPPRDERGALLGFLYLGSLLHMVEDMMTPPGPWAGLMMLWPLSQRRAGGFARIFWVNEYLIAVLSVAALLSLALLLLMKRTPMPLRKVVAGLMILTSLGGLAETARFISVSEFKNPSQWKTYQQDLLGESLYNSIHHLVLSTQDIWVREIL